MADWGKIGSRGNVEDRRSSAPAVVGGISVTGILLYLLVSYLTDGQVSVPLDTFQPAPQEQTQNLQEFEGSDEYEVFAATVLGSNNDLWEATFNKGIIVDEKGNEYGGYIPPKLVLFRTATDSSCGVATSQVGPHYCTLDSTIYLDETFFDELTQRYGATGGDVAEAYVMSHEVAHHVQNLMGITDAVSSEIQSNPRVANDLAMKLELQADCFAGLWANSIKDLNILSPNEIAEAMDAAAAVGDDRIQEKVTGRINPETWTHGSSEARVASFTKGYETGDIESCDTFSY
ncbi:MAG: hypothetical protein QG570_547 [Patescibacteria group bacterium]|nr:hypothetical protein [Patescibacteria group bacterium]